MASTYISKTLGSGNTRTWTWSGWLKRSTLDGTGDGLLFGASSDDYNVNYFDISLTSQNKININDYQGVSAFRYITNRDFRDTNAWYHIVIRFDSTQSTASDRCRLYINNVQETSFSTQNDPSLNFDALINSNVLHQMGGRTGAFMDCVMSHIHFCDGQSYAPTEFGETDATTGIWKPKTAPSVTYGTNGFFLKFENSGSMGTDSSGNANNFTVNGTMTQTIDTPSNVFATFNPLHKGDQLGDATFSNGNLTHQGTTSGASYPYTFSTLAASQGKWYAEFKRVSGETMIGIASGIADQFLGNATAAKGYAMFISGQVYYDGSSINYGNALNNNDIVGVAMDLDNNKLYFSINGVWQNSGDPTSGATGTGAVSITAPADNGRGVYHFAGGKAGNTITNLQSNFGNGYFGTTAVASAQNPDDGIGIFEYSVPTGYKALCTKSINAQEYD